MCTYALRAETFSIIQDSMLLLDQAASGCVESYVNICLVTDRDMFFEARFRDCVFFIGHTQVEGQKVAVVRS